MRMTAFDIASRAGGTVVAGDGAAVASSWTFDSRAVDTGACFVALAGERDGHDFVADAYRNGAHVAMVARTPHALDAFTSAAPRAMVQVPDVIAALQAVARAVRSERDDLRVAAITGSTGKTSTKDLVAAALPPGSVHASPESYNNEFGLPITLLNTPEPVRDIVAEMGERFPGDLAQLCDIARPQFGIVTNAGLAHAEYLGGPDGVVAVLAEMLEALPAEGLAVLNADDARTPELARRTAATVETVGSSPGADHRVDRIRLDATLHPEFTLDGVAIRVGLRGEHQVLNAALAAVLAGRGFGASWEDIVSGLRDARGSRWRMELSETADGVTVLDDSYNANPTSVHAALRALARLPVPRRIAVLGDMRELGDVSAQEHAAAGALAGALGIDVLVGVGEGGAQVVDGARGAVPTAVAVDDATAAIAAVRELVRAGDAVLVKASRALGLQVVAADLVEREPIP